MRDEVAYVSDLLGLGGDALDLGAKGSMPASVTYLRQYSMLGADWCQGNFGSLSWPNSCLRSWMAPIAQHVDLEVGIADDDPAERKHQAVCGGGIVRHCSHCGPLGRSGAREVTLPYTRREAAGQQMGVTKGGTKTTSRKMPIRPALNGSA